jgi:monovalent cation:H+ antiporter, CPA1 family
MLYINQFVGVQRWLGRALSQRFVELVGIRWATRRLLVFADQKTRPMIGDAATESITQCLRMRLQLVDENMQAMRLQYPAFAQWLEENYLGKLARTLERSRYRQMLSDSLISGEVYDALMAQLDDRWYFLDQQAPLDIELASVDLVHKVPLLSALSDQALRPLVKSLRTRLAMPNELIQGPSKPNPSLYFVASGAVSVLLPDATHIELGSGEFFGELYLLKPDAPEFEVRSLGYTKLLELSAKDFKNLVASDSQLREAIEKVAKERLRALEVGRSSLT